MNVSHLLQALENAIQGNTVRSPYLSHVES